MEARTERAIRHTLAKLPGVEIVEMLQTKRGHIRLIVKHGERTKTFSVSVSPASEEYSMRHVYRYVKKFTQEQ